MPDKEQDHPEEYQSKINIGDIGGDLSGNIAGRDINVTEEIYGNKNVFQGPITIYEGPPPPLPPAEARTRADLSILLKNVEMTWIKGVLEASVNEAALLELGIETRTDAVDHPWQMVLETPNQSPQVLPKGTRIKTVFEEANRLLLILGEPGSGKTTTLLQLARDLIAEVAPAFTQAVPVIFNLSTWTDQRQPLADWLITELSSKYRTPKKQGRHWLEERRILPLLDGLDEVKPENRAACVERINRLVVDYGLQGMAVCSRIKDYTDLKVRLQFNRAIYLQPLTSEQIDEYLERVGDKLGGLHVALRRDEALQHLAQSPLMLNIMSLAYQNSSAEDLNDPMLDTDEARYRHLFDTYIARMFKRKGDRWPYDAEQTKAWLAWLARNMQQHNQEVFLIEGLQPSWLQTSRWRFIYTLVSRLLGGMSIALSYGLGEGMSIALSYGLGEEAMTGLIRALSHGLDQVLILGPIYGLPVSVIDLLRFEWLDKRRDRLVVSHFWWLGINIAIVGLSTSLIFELIVWLNGGFFNLGLLFGLIGGLIFGPRGSRQSRTNDIQTVEALHWSSDKALKGGLIFALIGGLIFGLSFGLSDAHFIYAYSGLSRLSKVLNYGLIGGLIFGISGVAFYGLSREIIKTKTTPNQGIRLSVRNAVFGGLSIGLGVGLGVGLGIGLNGGVDIGLRGGLSLGLFVGLLGFLWYGGFDIIQHYTLRLILIIQGHTPRDYAHFLDYAVERIFLQKVGGGYRFIHRLLLEHFAKMEPDKIKK